MRDLRSVAKRVRSGDLREELAALCRRNDVSLLVLFGSAAAGRADPRDIDIAVRFDPYEPTLVLGFLDGLADVVGTDRVDLMVLNTAGPVAREEALIFGEVLFMAAPDLFAEAQIAATMERLDTDHLRCVELEMLRFAVSPHDFRAAVVQARLAQMRELLADIDRLGDVGAEDMAADRFVRHVAQHVLVQLVQLAVAINSHPAAAIVGKPVTDYRTSFDAAVSAGLINAGLAESLKPSVGLRNVVVHEYVDVDHAVVAAARPLARRDYAQYVRSAADWLSAM